MGGERGGCLGLGTPLQRCLGPSLESFALSFWIVLFKGL